nr:RNA-directed DNA polymerase, eukaryota [Tanacetum cinerariifolium]
MLKSVSLYASDLIEIHDMKNVILVKARDVHLTLNINNVLRKEGFYDFQDKYIGGMWLWLQFDSIESCNKLQSNKEMAWVKEFAGWVPDIEAMDTHSDKKSDVEIPEEQDNIIDDHDARYRKKRKQKRSMLRILIIFLGLKKVETLTKITRCISNKSDYEKVKIIQPRNHLKPLEHSSSSCPGAKSSRASKPISKAFSNHGSMTEALVSQIEMGKVLGYDMEGSTNDLKKLIEGIGAKHGNWLHSHLHCFMVNVYAPQYDRNKEILWNSIIEFKEKHLGHYIIFGDFNVVHFASERIDTMFNSSSANAFNQFIINGSFWEFPPGGHLFTRIIDVGIN